MLGTMNLLAAPSPSPPAQVPLSSRGIEQPWVSAQVSTRPKGVTWSQDRVPDERCFRSERRASALLEESQMSVPYPCQLLAGDPSLTPFPGGLHR